MLLAVDAPSSARAQARDGAERIETGGRRAGLMPGTVLNGCAHPMCVSRGVEARQGRAVKLKSQRIWFDRELIMG